MHKARGAVLPIVLAILFAFAANADSQTCLTSGCLDSTFGQNGQTIFQPATTGTIAHRNSVLQSDNKIVTLLQTNVSVRNILARLNPDGSLDNTFGTGGYVYMTWGGTGSGVAYALTKQVIAGEERFVTAGWAPCGRKSCLRVERYTSSGSLDTTFGSGGVATISAIETATIVTVQPTDQKILLLGSGTVSRLTAGGLLDPTFGSNGTSNAAGFAPSNVTATATGKIFVCGSLSVRKASYLAVASLNGNGSLDTTFGNGGRATADFAGTPFSVIVDPVGRIIVAGQAQLAESSSLDAILARFLAGGQIDASFGTGGKTRLDMGGGQDLFKSVAVQSNGKIVATGEGRFAGHTADFLTAAYSDDGSADMAFGSGGWVMTDMFGLYDQAQSVLVQSDPACGCEKIIVVGAGTVAAPATYQTVALRYVP
jgi:uncharacterized delta-60 repeat protein